ncbi:MAG: acyl-CoA dehydrogenase family protein [Desulfobacteraceae bacterium]|nr:acyl-CoA dehydrogenase family protein [Desulfobacteraceae bacterium]
MGNADTSNQYSFAEFLQWRDNVNYYEDDPFIQKVVKTFTGEKWKETDKAAREVSKKASYRWRDLSNAAAVPEKRPYLTRYDGHNNRIDRIERPMETLIMEKEIFKEGLFSSKTSPFEKFIKLFLIYQNGEASISCPLTCTEGLIALLEKYSNSYELKYILEHCKEGLDGDFAIGAQYLSEIQGGSDVPSNVLEAQEENGEWRLYGDKFFCSATHADYVVVTAKPEGSEKVALFIVPSWMPGNKEKEIRNGYTINRIKWKMGTSELTTAEITFNGAVAYPVGPMDRGVANVVGIVLTYSRMTVGLSGGAFMSRAVREAKAYSRFRTAFGLKIGDFPLAALQLKNMEHAAQRTTAAAFKINRDIAGLEGGIAAPFKDEKDRRKRFDIRELIMLQKIVSSWDCTDILRSAMSIFGGHGVMEDFSSLPRLYRDSAINELWEGPRNVLLTQIHRDFVKALSWYSPKEFVKSILKGSDEQIIEKLAKEMSEP